jgi:hypothetical protein
MGGGSGPGGASHECAVPINILLCVCFPSKLSLSLSKRVRLAADLLQEKSTVGHSVRMLFSPFLSLWEKVQFW